MKKRKKKATDNREPIPNQERNAEAERRSRSDVWVAFLDWGGKGASEKATISYEAILSVYFKSEIHILL